MLAATCSWLYATRVLTPWEHHIYVESGNLRAQMGDLYPRWVGTRALLLRGENPYGPDLSHEIQLAYYGHAVSQDLDKASGKRLDEQRFAYPVYVAFLLAPIARVAFDTVQSWAPAFLAVLLAASTLLWFKVSNWKPGTLVVVAIIGFILSTPQVAQGLRLRQLGFAVVFFLALATWCAYRNFLLMAGVSLALSTIKPQMSVLPVAWFLLWGIGDLGKRWRFLASFSVSLLALAGAGELMLPGWIHFFIDGLRAYPKYVPAKSLLQVAMGNGLGLVFAVIVIGALLAWAWGYRTHPAGSPEFATVLSAFFIVSTVALPLLAPYNQTLLILPLLIILRDWAAIPLFGRCLFVFCVAWPWITSMPLLIFATDLKTQNSLPALPFALVFLLPFLVAALLRLRRTTKRAGLPIPSEEPQANRL